MIYLPSPDLPYTTTDTVRGYLGIDEGDAPDSLLVSRNLGDTILTDLEEWLPDYADVVQDAQKFRWIKQYCAIQAAWHVARAPLTFIQSFSDGKVAGQRFKIDFAQLQANLQSEALRYRKLLEDEADLPTASTNFGVSTPDYDPITG